MIEVESPRQIKPWKDGWLLTGGRFYEHEGKQSQAAVFITKADDETDLKAKIDGLIGLEKGKGLDLMLVLKK